jgi:hypothetical protein
MRSHGTSDHRLSTGRKHFFSPEAPEINISWRTGLSDSFAITALRMRIGDSHGDFDDRFLLFEVEAHGEVGVTTDLPFVARTAERITRL